MFGARKELVKELLITDKFIEDDDTEFINTYIALKYRLGYINPYVGDENLTSHLLNFATFALKHLGRGLGIVANKVFSVLRAKTEKILYSYKNIVGVWESRIFKNARKIDGDKFDSYMLKIPPYKVLSMRIDAIISVHQALSNINGIYNSSVSQKNNWLTNECQKAIDAMAKIGFDARHYDMLIDSVSKEYADADIKQSMFLHKYTIKNIMTLFNKVKDVAKYADPNYLAKYMDNFNVSIDRLDETEAKLLEEYSEAESEEKSTESVDKKQYELSMRAARLWWVIHFIKSAYKVTSDVFRAFEKITLATESCIATESPR